MCLLMIVCGCSTGARHRQLVKSGNDDLRQDAVMQQLFGLINEVLAHSPATAKRRLRIATYKVGPISSLDSVQILEAPRQGILVLGRYSSAGLQHLYSFSDNVFYDAVAAPLMLRYQ